MGSPRALLAAVALLCSVGCGQPTDVQSTVDAAQFLLATEPAGVLPVSLVRDQLTEAQDVVLLGRIGGVAQPWQPGVASFVMADPTANEVSEGDHVCTDPGCPFCSSGKKSATESLALVRFVDADGETLLIDARTLLGVKENEMVVVQGRASIDPLGYVNVTARGIYIRR